MTHNPTARRALMTAALATLCAVHFADARQPKDGEGAAPGAPLETVLERFDRAQSQVRTLQADFTETKSLAMLKEPVVSRGKFFYTHPNDILWEYTEPVERIFLIRREELLAYYPEEKRAEQLDIGRYHGRLLKVLGIGQVSRDLEKYYDISLARPEPEAGQYELVLSPRRRQVKKRISEVRFWIDAERYLPVRMQYSEEDGDRTTISFRGVRLNGPIDEATYRIELPADVTVERTFTGLGSARGAS